MKMKSYLLGLLIVFCLGGLSTASDLDPLSPNFDPDKQYSITPYGAIMGDPAQLDVVSSNKVGYSIITVNPTPDGLTVMFSVIEPQQNGEAGGGYAMMMSLEETDVLLDLLEKAPNADVAELEPYGENHKLLGRVTAPDHARGEVAVIFKSDDNEKAHIRIVQILAGTPSIFEFTPNAIKKLSEQIRHFVDKAKKQAESTKL